jgi:hypothetical protein
MVPLQLILFSIPSIIYAVVQRRRGMEWRPIFERLGLQGSRPVYFLWTLGVTLVTGALGWVAFSRIPPEIFTDPNISLSEYAGWFLGWLRFRSASILPGWLAHSLINALGALPMMN